MIVVFNPTAGARRASLLWRVLDILQSSGLRLDVRQTAHAGHARALAQQAAAEGAPMVVAAGGDGTIAEVVDGLLGSPARLGIIPLGTANVLAHELGLSFAPAGVAAALAFGRTRLLWPGLAHSAGGSRLFVQMLGAGFDAQVVHDLPLPLKRALGRGAYVVQSLAALASYGFPSLQLRIDGVEMVAASVIISKGRLYGGRYMLAPRADPSAPGFTVVLFAYGGRLPALLYGAALPLNLLPHAPGLRQLHAQRVDILNTVAVPAQADGDAAGAAPVSVCDAAQPIAVVVG